MRGTVLPPQPWKYRKAEAPRVSPAGPHHAPAEQSYMCANLEQKWLVSSEEEMGEAERWLPGEQGAALGPCMS